MKKLTQDEFIKEANRIHNNRYDYSKTNYITNNTKIIIGCPIHGDFLQQPKSHIHRGHGCPKCGDIRTRLTVQEFIDKVSRIHHNRYDYSKVNYINHSTKIIIICPLHGEFKQTPNVHGSGSGCPICKLSKGELMVKIFLEDNKIQYIPQHTFDECKGKRYKLPFDFFLPEYNILIEFDGKQHFTGWNNSIEKLKILQENDAIKNKYCADNCIRLLRISYKEISLIEEKIKQFLI